MAENDPTSGQLGSAVADATRESRRVLIAVPVFTHVGPEALCSFMSQCLMAGRYASEWVFDVAVPKRQLLHMAMNDLGHRVLAGDYAGLIVADDDCFPPPDAIVRLLAHAPTHPIVAALGLMRGYPHTTTIGQYFAEGQSIVRRKDGHIEFKGFKWLDDIRGLPPLMDVDFCGAPIMWIARDVFARTPPPWYGTWLDGGSVTHDVYFARQVKRQGFRVLVDTTIRCGHMRDADIVDFSNRGDIRGMRIALEAMKACPSGNALEALQQLETPA